MHLRGGVRTAAVVTARWGHSQFVGVVGYVADSCGPTEHEKMEDFKI